MKKNYIAANKNTIVKVFVRLITVKLNVVCQYKNNTQPICVVKNIVLLNVFCVAKSV